MSEKRFILKRSNALSSNYRLGERVYDTVLKKELYNLEVVDLLNEQQATIEQLNLAIDDLLSHTSCDEIKKENEQLKERLYDFEKQKIIEESRIDEDVIPKIKLLRNELFGEKFERETI